MNHSYKLLYMVVLLFIGNSVISYGQDKNNPWSVSIGTNAIDFYPVNMSAPYGKLFDDFFEVKRHWNTNPALSRLGVSRYLGGGVVIGIDGAANSIRKIGDERLYKKMSYYSVNANINYNFGYVFSPDNQYWFDPFVGLSGGMTWLDNEGVLTGGVRGGVNFWIFKNLALEVGTMGVLPSKDKTNYRYRHFQHFAGIKFAFGIKDSDGDGIPDKYDECPDDPGLKEFNGCPDTDGDGIPDHLDECPELPGLAEFNGCPDTDGDGIPDHLDECPEEPGLEEFNGCPDTDGDGVPDHLDECPDVPGPKENNGCPWPDRDGDGVPDHLDECPDEPGPASNDGCPEEPPKEVVKELNEYSKTILFEFNKATITLESSESLKSMGDVIKSYPNAKFHLAGFTDNTGEVGYNNNLSRDRAAAVRDYLIDKLGIEANRLSSEGYGPKNPVATNRNAEGRKQNRRVEIMLQKDRVTLEQNM